MDFKHRTLLLWLLLVCLASLLRIVLALHPGLWVDEIFSLAMATGHSLEHPAAKANAAFGDYVESPDPQQPSTFRRYTQHDLSPAGPSRVIRAVLLSDTSPPLYYLMLNLWTRFVGTSDAALRFFSVLCAIACFPLLWLLGLELANKRAAWAASILFTVCPLALYYSAEGRMYSFVWLLALMLAWSTLAIAARGSRPHLLALWILSAVSGLLTHYFFAFVLAACLAWMILHTNKVYRLYIAGLTIVTALIVLPWYIQLPESLSGWRVTNGWLDHPLSWRQVTTNSVKLACSYISVSGIWGGWNRGNVLALGVYASIVLFNWRRGIAGLFKERWRLLWFWMLCSTVGPVVFDLLLGRNTSSIAKYALPGLPAAILLVAMATSMVSRKTQAAFLIFMSLLWLPSYRLIFAEPSRPWEPFHEVGSQMNALAEAQDLIIVHSIPSGVLGVARYMDNTTPVVSWVVQLKQRGVDDMERLLSSRRKVALVKIHDMNEPSPAEVWLLQHWQSQEPHDSEKSDPRIQYFVKDRFDKPQQSATGGFRRLDRQP